MKAQFFNSLIIKSLPGRWWKVTEPLCYYSALADATFCAPPEFVFDGDSGPFNGKPTPSSCIHDLGYRGLPVGYIMMDRVFNEAEKVDGRSLPVRWFKAGGLFLIGWAFKKNLPGCLDPRNCERKPHCIYCDKFYSKWERCYVPGYHPELWKEHV